jgi:succinoglycan biosynthesis transport protein ExoP
MVQAQVITRASTPTEPSWPPKPIVLLGSLVLGLAAGAAIGVGRDLFDRTVRNKRQLEAASRSNCIGVLPRVRLRRRMAARIKRSVRLSDAGPARTFSDVPQFAVSMDYPTSMFAETLRALKVACGPAAVNVLGITSAVPREGRTTVAANFARLLGSTSAGVLLVDADLRNPALSRKLVPAGSPGLLQLLDGATLDEVLWSDPEGHAYFLPAGSDRPVLDSSEKLASAGMSRLYQHLRGKFAFVVVDLPPVLPSVDVSAAVDLFDGLAFVTRWGSTTRDAVSEAFDEQGVSDRIIGTLLNDVDLSRLPRFDRTAWVRRAAW